MESKGGGGGGNGLIRITIRVAFFLLNYVVSVILKKEGYEVDMGRVLIRTLKIMGVANLNIVLIDNGDNNFRG